MNLTDLWYELVDMTKSDAPLFVINDRKITERQFIWIIGLFLAILVLIAIKNLAMWVVGGSAKKIAKAVAPTKKLKGSKKKNKKIIDGESKEVEEIKPENDDDKAKSPEDLLENTSEKRRTLYDYVTPDSVHSDIVKQTLNKDYPYQTLKPDKAKINISSDQSSTPAIKQEETISKIEFAKVPKNEPILRNAPTVGISSVERSDQQKTQSSPESNKLSAQPNQQMNNNSPNSNSGNATLPPIQNNNSVPVTNNPTTDLPQQQNSGATQATGDKSNIQPEFLTQNSDTNGNKNQVEKIQQHPTIPIGLAAKQQATAAPVNNPLAETQQPMSSQSVPSNVGQKDSSIIQNPQQNTSKAEPILSAEKNTDPTTPVSPHPTTNIQENNVPNAQNQNTAESPTSKNEISSAQQVPPKQNTPENDAQQIFNPADPLLP